MANYTFNLRNLCTPASIYFVISMFILVVLILQNLGATSRNVLCVGDYKCDVGNIFVTLFINLLYIAFWTLVLDLLCKNGFKKISWIIVLLPILLFFIALTTMMLYYPMY